MSFFRNKCFISLAIEALALKKKFKLYKLEKEISNSGNEGANVNKCLCKKYSKYSSSMCHFAKVGSEKNGFFERFLVDDSIENFIIKSILGFIGGILLTYICFMFLVFSLNFTLKRATYICMGLGIVLSLGLAFSVKIRCTVFLCIPQLFSKRGRQALLAYAFILALSGPAKNTLHNVEVMSESLACGQEQLKQAENELLKCVQKPNAAAKKSVEKLLEKLNSAVKYLKNFILQLYRNCFDILETVLHGQKWLYSISFLCHKKMGLPAQRCFNLLDEASENCKSIDERKSWEEICEIRPKEMICPSNSGPICVWSDVPQRLPVPKFQRQLEGFKHRAMNIFFVRADVHQTYSQSNRSTTYHEEYQGMATEIRQKTDQFLQYFDFMSVIFGIFILVLFVKVIIYRHRFLTQDHYDNRYITSDFEDIDSTRAEFRMETVLPLEPRERMKYIKVTSIRLVPCEKVRLLSSFVFLIFATFKIIIHMLTDSTLYWILSMVRREERMLYMSTIRDEEPSVAVRVMSDGLVAALFRNVTKAVKRQSTTTRLDPTPCLPDPVPPDWNRYYQILALVLICWLLALCEPYGLRLRHTVMVTYHPDRARERAIWLYNRIISNRTSFLKIARRDLRRKYKDAPKDYTFSFQFLRKKATQRCLLCKVKIGSTGDHVTCSTPNCVGVYCNICFASLKFCSICSDPEEYGDSNDLSEEKDSSEDETSCKYYKKKKKLSTPVLKSKKCTTLAKDRGKHRRRKYKKEDLLQPKLLMDAVGYCKNKISLLKKQKNASDVESSDWEINISLGTEDSLGEDKLKEISYPSEEESPKKCKGKRRVKFLITEKECDELEKPKDHVSLRLFRKISNSETELAHWDDDGSNNLQDNNDSENIEKENSNDRPKPDFWFKKLDRDDLKDSKPSGFLNVKDSWEKIRKTIPSRSNSKTDVFSDSEMEAKTTTLMDEEKSSLIKAEDIESVNGNASENNDSLPSNTPNPEPSITNPPSQRGQIFPFVDPATVHQFNLTLGLAGNFAKKETVVTEEKYSEKLTYFNVQRSIVKLNSTSSRARVYYEGDETLSSDSVSGRPTFCVKEESKSSTMEYDCQFYSQTYRSAELGLVPGHTKSNLQRAAATLNLIKKQQTHSKRYSIETDSSDDRFLSVRSIRKARRKL